MWVDAHFHALTHSLFILTNSLFTLTNSPCRDYLAALFDREAGWTFRCRKSRRLLYANRDVSHVSGEWRSLSCLDAVVHGEVVCYLKACQP